MSSIRILAIKNAGKKRKKYAPLWSRMFTFDRIPAGSLFASSQWLSSAKRFEVFLCFLQSQSGRFLLHRLGWPSEPGSHFGGGIIWKQFLEKVNFAL